MKPVHIVRFQLPVTDDTYERVAFFRTAAKAAKGVLAAKSIGMIAPSASVVPAGELLFDVNYSVENRVEMRAVTIAGMDALMRGDFKGCPEVKAWWNNGAAAKPRSPMPEDFEGEPSGFNYINIVAYQAFEKVPKK